MSKSSTPPKPHIANKLRLKSERIKQRTTNVSDGFKANQQLAHEQLWAAAYSSTIDDSKLIQLYCNKTGRPIRKISIEEIQQSLAAHDSNRTTELLQLYQTQQCSIAWLTTDSHALSNLAKSDPIGYCVYSIGLIYHQPARCKNSELQLPMLEDKIQAFKQLNGAVECQPDRIDRIIELNELIRRVFSIVSPFELTKHEMFRNNQFVQYWTDSIEHLNQFKQKLIDVLLMLVDRKLGARIRTTDVRYISYSELCELRLDNKGLAAYRLQPNPNKQSTVDPEIMLMLRDFIASNKSNNSNNSSRNLFEPAKKTQMVVAKNQQLKVNKSGKLKLKLKLKLTTNQQSKESDQ